MPTLDYPAADYDELFLLWGARESGILDALTSTAGTADAVASEADVPQRVARLTVTALADLGYLRQVGEEYEPTNRLLGFLATRDLRSIGRRPHALDLLSLVAQLPATMRGGNPEMPEEWTRNRLGAHAATDEATIRAHVTAAIREVPDTTRVLDLFGESGAYATEFAAHGYDVTMVETPDVVAEVEPLLERRDIQLCEGDELDLPRGEFDLVFGADVLWRRDRNDAQACVASAAEVVDTSGAVVFVERLQSGESTAAVVDALARGVGEPLAESRVREWFESAGLVDVAVRRVPGTDHHAIVGHRRG